MSDMNAELEALRASMTPKEADVTVVELNQLAANIAQLRTNEDAASEAKKKITAALEASEKQMIELLTKHSLTNYRAPAGLCTITHRTSVKTPKTPEAKAEFYEYLKKIGKYDDLMSVNSATLNSFYKEQFELAKERQDDDFNIPGLTEVTINQNLSFRRS